MVSASGTRSSASARHIRPTPSSVDSPYSARKLSIIDGVVSPRTRRTSSAPAAAIASRAAASTRSEAISSRMTAASSAA